MSRKLLSLVVAVAFVLMSMSTGFAAAVPSDVTADYAKAVSKLSSLGVMGGYPDGTFKPDQTITRAEFAKIAVVAMGLKDAASISGGTTSFKDVAADNWAAGFINVAAAQGIITGYPDGTYKPDQTISYAEAITILAKMLGYGPILAGKPWPSAYVAKASEPQVGITSGVVLAPTVGASRGNVAKLMSNTLDAHIVVVSQYDLDGKPTYQVDAVKTLLSEKLKVTLLGDGQASVCNVFTVSNTPCLQNSASTSDPTLTSTDNTKPPSAGTYKGFAAGLNANDYLGLDIKAWVNSDNKIVIAEIQNDASDIYEGIVSKDGDNLKLEGLSKSYSTADSPFVAYLNGTGSATLTTVKLFGAQLNNDKANARVVLHNGKVKGIYAWADQAYATATNGSTNFIVKEVKDGFIRAINTVVSDIKVQTIKDNLANQTLRLDVIRDGKAATIDDVAAGDIVTRVDLGGADAYTGYQRWIVSSGTVTGTVSSISGTGADMTMTVGGKDYTLEGLHKFSFNKGSDYNKTYVDVASIVGKSVTLTLNSVGQVATLVSDANSSTYYYGIAKDSITGVGVTGSDTNLILYKADGTKVTYLLNDPTNAINKAACAAIHNVTTSEGYLVQYQLTSDGKIADDSLYYGAGINNGKDFNYYTTSGTEVGDTTDNTITVGTTIYSILSGTVIYDIYNIKAANASGDVQVLPYSAIKKQKAAIYQVLVSGVTAKYISAYYPLAGVDQFSSSPDGVVLATGYDGDGQTATINENGTVKTYKLATAISGNFISKGWASYTVNSAGKISSVVNVGSYVYNGHPKLGAGGDYTGSANVTGAIYRIESMDTKGSVIDVKALTYDTTSGSYVETGDDLYFRYNTDTKFYDASDDSKPVTTFKGGLAATAFGAGDWIWIDKEDQGITLGNVVKVKYDNITKPTP